MSENQGTQELSSPVWTGKINVQLKESWVHLGRKPVILELYEGDKFILNILVNVVMAEHLQEHSCSAINKEYKSVFQLRGGNGLRNAKSTPIKLQKVSYNHISPSTCCPLFPAAFVAPLPTWPWPQWWIGNSRCPSPHQHSKHQQISTKSHSPRQPMTRGTRLSPLHPTGWTLLEWQLKQSNKFILGDGFHPACLCCAIPQRNTGPPHDLFFTP